jgi:hypothetical protein
MLTLDVYGDYIPEDDGGAVNPLPEPTARRSERRKPTSCRCGDWSSSPGLNQATGGAPLNSPTQIVC